MATDELKVLQQQALVKSMDLGINAGPAKLGESIQSAGGKLADKVGNFAIEAAGKEGARDALAGKQVNLAPSSMGKATQAYNESFSKIQTELVSNKTADLMNQDYLQVTKPGNIGPDSIARFNELAKSRIEGAVSGVDKSLQPFVAANLQNQAVKFGSNVATSVEKFNQKNQEEAFKYTQDKNLTNISELRAQGNMEGFNQAIEHAKDNIASFKDVGAISEIDAQKQLDALNKHVSATNVQTSYLEALRDGRGEEFLRDYATNKPQDLSFQEWLDGGAQALKLKSEYDSLVGGQESINLANWTNKINAGQVQSINDLEPATSQMSQLNFQKLLGHFYRANKKAADLNAKKDDFVRLNSLNPSKAKESTAPVKNAAFQDALEAFRQQKIEETQNPNYQLSLDEEVQASTYFNVPIPELSNKISYSLENGSPEEAMQAAQVYQKYFGGPGEIKEPIKSVELSNEAEKIALKLAFKDTFSAPRDEAAMADSVFEIRKSLKSKDDFLVEQQMREANNFILGGTKKAQNNLASTFKDTFGVSMEDNTKAAGAFRKNLAENMAIPGLSKEEALDKTQREMRNLWGTSRYSANPKELVLRPLEKSTEFAEFGNWLPNQLRQGALMVAKNHEKAEMLASELPQNFEKLRSLQNEYTQKAQNGLDNNEELGALIQDIVDLRQRVSIGSTFSQSQNKVMVPKDYLNVEAPSQEFLVNGDLTRKKESSSVQQFTGTAGKPSGFRSPIGSLLINGVEKEIFAEPNPDGTYTYTFINENGSKDFLQDPFSESTLATINIIPFAEFVPEVARDMNNSSVDNISDAVSKAEFDRDNPISLLRQLLEPRFSPPAMALQEALGQETAAMRAARKKEFVESRKPEVTERLRGKK